MSSQPLTQKISDGKTIWLTSCGCGGKWKPEDIVIPPNNSVAVLIQKTGPLVGPKTGITYNIIGAYVSIDIDWDDAAVWRKEGLAIDSRQGLKGILTRAEPTPATPAQT